MSQPELVAPENASHELKAAVRVVNYLLKQSSVTEMTASNILGSRTSNGIIIIRNDSNDICVMNETYALLKTAGYRDPLIVTVGVIVFTP
ncbi:MAG TPA: hypothetical protein VK502_00485 [Candidatus Saccharimonadales bacterium]|nr:hypothetical protein [Candidatus Saccharimonadales bacterium]